MKKKLSAANTSPIRSLSGTKKALLTSNHFKEVSFPKKMFDISSRIESIVSRMPIFNPHDPKCLPACEINENTAIEIRKTKDLLIALSKLDYLRDNKPTRHQELVTGEKLAKMSETTAKPDQSGNFSTDRPSGGLPSKIHSKNPELVFETQKNSEI